MSNDRRNERGQFLPSHSILHGCNNRERRRNYAIDTAAIFKARGDKLPRARFEPLRPRKPKSARFDLKIFNAPRRNSD